MAADCGSSCPVEGGWYSYDPSLAGNAIITAAFAFLIPVTLFLGVRHHTPFFATVLTTGITLEVVGFAGRILLHGSRDDKIYFLISQLGTVVGPTFVASALFVTLPHILAVYGTHLSPVRPLIVAFTFYIFVVVAAVLQVVGVVFISGEFRNVTRKEGATVIAASSGVLLGSLLWTIALRTWLALGISKARPGPTVTHSWTYKSSRFRRFLTAFDTTSGLLLASSIYRLVEMIGGPKGELFQQEASFMVMNGALPLASTIILSVFHPGHAFTHPVWSATSPHKVNRRASYPSFAMGASIRTTLASDAHIRYDPNIRSRFSPNEPDTQRLNPYDSLPLPQYAQTPHDIQRELGNPGLPSHPRALKDIVERRTSAGSARGTVQGGERSPRSDVSGSTTQAGDKSPWDSIDTKRPKRGSDPTSQPRPKKPHMVDSEALWY